ncbi:unnamed protein product [Cylindrotheca closterium]|uniref:Uncharacterized protein n=1 Tax=Cylindrotheca closterium TaxID=2856 RepID=A0AAD2JK10_9STRA|nr:unnamed protein product [Cylindrotheca closterium]
MPSYHYFGKEGEAIPEDVEELVIHPLVEEIPRTACCKFEHLTRVHFNGSALEVIGSAAFYDCTRLLEIEIPASVKIVLDSAFSSCKSLTKVRFHEDDGLLTTIGGSAFAYCSSLAEVRFPSSLMTIHKDAFHECRLLTRVFFQEGLKTIASSAFGRCVNLETVDTPKSLEMLGGGAFQYCASLQDVTIKEGALRVIERGAFRNCNEVQNGLKYVGEKVFYLCKKLQAVALPGSLELIGGSAFEGCPKLVSVELGDGPSTVTIHDEAFLECRSLVNICLPSSASIPTATTTEAVSDSFEGCTSLKSLYDDTNTMLALRHRFKNFPIHKKCYYASITTTGELTREIELSMQSSQDTTGDDLLIDPFGMTPFHVLLSAAYFRLDLLQVLLDAYPANVLRWKDLNGKTAVEYYYQRGYHLSEDSQTILQAALHRWMVGSIRSWDGLEAWTANMSSRVDAIVAEHVVERRRYLLREASMALSRYEEVEATSLLELSLWENEMKSAIDASAENGARVTVYKDERVAYRIRSGASVVIPNVIAFLFSKQ